MPRFASFALFATLAAAWPGNPRAAGTAPVPYPDGYRQWTHVKSMQIHAGHALFGTFGGVHHVYANPRAMKGYASGRFPDGAVIVFDLREAVTSDHATTAGPRKAVGVMRKDAKRHAATGGWGFEAFKGDSTTERVVGDGARTACFECHAAQRERDYVFSRFER
jgi:hypothetical protein